MSVSREGLENDDDLPAGRSMSARAGEERALRDYYEDETAAGHRSR